MISGSQTALTCAEACMNEPTCYAFDHMNGKCYIQERCDLQDAGDGFLSCKKITETVSFVASVSGVTEVNKQLVCDSFGASLQGNVVYCSLNGPSNDRRQ